MQKTIPSFGRVAVMVGFALSVFGLLLFLWLAFGGPIPLKAKGYRVQVAFKEATALAQEADVRISGVPVGRVRTLDVRPSDNATIATIELKPRYAPLPSDARAVLRQKTLLGETYVEITPGTKAAPKIPDGGSMREGNVSPTVEIDEIFRTFDTKTRDAFRIWMQGLAQGVGGRGREISETLGNLAPLADSGQKVFETLNSQKSAVQRLVANTGEVFAALTARDHELSSLITNSDDVFAATARRNRDLAAAFVALPTFERESRLTSARLAKFAKQTNPLITQLRPAARELTPTLQQLARLAPDLRLLFRDLDPVITASRKGLPATRVVLDQLRPLLAETDPTLRELDPLVSFVSGYKRELTAFLANTVASTQASDQPPKSKGPVHYLRTANPLNPENLSAYPSRLPTNRPNPYIFPNGYDRLKDGLLVYEDRQCGTSGVPVLGAPLEGVLPAAINDLVRTFVFSPLFSGVAPPCVKQPSFTVTGRTSQYPQVTARGTAAK